MATMNGFVHFNNYLILMSHGKKHHTGLEQQGLNNLGNTLQ